MKRTTLALIAAIGLINAAQAANEDVLTAEGGVVCLRPYSLSQGIAAYNRGDMAWMKEAGCITPKADIVAVRLNVAALTNMPADAWQVRLILPDGGVTVWGFSQSFKTKAGKRFPSLKSILGQ